MRVLEVGGKTVEEAVKKALEQLALSLECVDVEVLIEPTNGLFGLIGSRQARVRITEKIKPNQFMLQFLEGILDKMGMAGTIDILEDADSLRMNVKGKNLGMLIGKRGQALNALQYLMNVVYHKKFPNQEGRLVLDVENYREKREETLRILAENLAKKAVRTRREVVLEPMTPMERRIIHTALQDEAAVTTFSEGEEPYRKVVIVPK